MMIGYALLGQQNSLSLAVQPTSSRPACSMCSLVCSNHNNRTAHLVPGILSNPGDLDGCMESAQTQAASPLVTHQACLGERIPRLLTGDLVLLSMLFQGKALFKS